MEQEGGRGRPAVAVVLAAVMHRHQVTVLNGATGALTAACRDPPIGRYACRTCAARPPGTPTLSRRGRVDLAWSDESGSESRRYRTSKTTDHATEQ
jgi:hypothetical protein